jgi:DNA repair photolyase
MKIKQVHVKGILQKSKLPEISHVINPYIGCVHGCVYCYARFMKRFTDHKETWGTFLDPKINGPDILKRQLNKRKKPLKEPVFISSVTDPYQPPEKKYELTRKLLKVLLEYQVPISILTKSDLIMRDVDLLKQFDNCTIGLSFCTLDDGLAKRLEPRATIPSQRHDTLRALKEQGISTYGFISPYIPRLSDIHQLTKALNGAIDGIGVEVINTRGGNWQGVEILLRRHYPERLKECRRLIGNEGYLRGLENEARRFARENHIEMMGFYRHQ